MDSKKLVYFLHEAGLLRRTPRSGWQTIGKQYENVAEHSFRTAVVGYALCKMEGLGNEEQRQVVLGCLFHDLSEARCSDLNLMNRKYAHAHHEKALADCVKGTGLEEILSLPIDKKGGIVAALINDADKLELLFSAKEYMDEGNKYAKVWIANGKPLLRTKSAKKLLSELLKGDSRDWMFKSNLFKQENRKK